MKKLIGLAFLLLCVGCKGPAGKDGSQGPKGDQGNMGLPGPGQFVFLNGNVTSDDFTVVDSRINLADQVGVYIGDGTASSELPYYLPALGVNAYYLLKSGQVEIVNAQKAGASKYVIEIIIP